MLRKTLRIIKNMFTASDTNVDHWKVLTDKDQVEEVLKIRIKKHSWCTSTAIPAEFVMRQKSRLNQFLLKLKNRLI